MDVLSAIGNTPLVKLKCGAYAKLEYYNPTGSVKDRIARQIVEDAEKNGKLKKEMTILEATSGNTGISMAFVGAVKGYKVKIIMPSCMTMERRAIITGFGAELELADDPIHAINKAERYAKEKPKVYFFANQFANQSNVKAHLKTGEEIWRQTKGKITHFFAGLGTGGTITGVAKYLKKKNPQIKIIAVEPKENEIIQGLMNLSFREKYAKILEPELVDEFVEISLKDAITYQKKLMLEEGVFGGQSSGAIYKVVLECLDEAKFPVFVVPDAGFKYLSILSIEK
ncbi:MAG: PLP-dependent cysteine synthase family protein [Candidatus Anstonellales archaeon]